MREFKSIVSSTSSFFSTHDCPVPSISPALWRPEPGSDSSAPAQLGPGSARCCPHGGCGRGTTTASLAPAADRAPCPAPCQESCKGPFALSFEKTWAILQISYCAAVSVPLKGNYHSSDSQKAIICHRK